MNDENEIPSSQHRAKGKEVEDSVLSLPEMGSMILAARIYLWAYRPITSLRA